MKEYLDMEGLEEYDKRLKEHIRRVFGLVDDVEEEDYDFPRNDDDDYNEV